MKKLNYVLIFGVLVMGSYSCKDTNFKEILNGPVYTGPQVVTGVAIGEILIGDNVPVDTTGDTKADLVFSRVKDDTLKIESGSIVVGRYCHNQGGYFVLIAVTPKQ